MNVLNVAISPNIPPYVAVRDSEENPDGTFTVYVTCQRCLLNFTVWNYKPKPHQLPKK